MFDDPKGSGAWCAFAQIHPHVVALGNRALGVRSPRRLLCESSGASRLVSCGLQASLVCIAILVQIFFRASLAPSS